MIGTSIGPYQILAKLGAGGMGEVYRARDTSLGRDVAIKVLPVSVAADPERLARFDREAKVLASLSHPNIAQIYGLQSSSAGSGPSALVMELAAGEDLALHIARGAMSLHDALPVATQIALALEAAHERGIVHRDLKPANIKVTDEGAVKVLDFGLAKALNPSVASGSADAMNSPTLTAAGFAQGYGAPGTEMGVILGTAAYMSPEQARGREADKRADVWAFGVVFFEMLTGARLFQGDTISDTLAAVLRQDIPWNALPAGTPAEITRLLRRCLERDRKNRLHDIADARIVLEEVTRGGAKDDAPAAAPAQRGRSMWPLAAAAVAVGAAAFVAGRLTAPAAAPAQAAPTIRLVIPAPEGVTHMSEPAVAPDGSFVVFVGDLGPKSRQLFIHRLNETSSRPIARTDGAVLPTVSSDLKWVVYQRSNRIEKIALNGGEPIVLTEIARTGGPGMTSVPGGRIVYAASWLGPLSAVSIESGKPQPVSTLDPARGEVGHWFPNALPDGRHVIMTVWTKATGINDAEAAVLDLETGRHTVLFKGAEARFVSPGFLVFYRAGGYHAIRFDPVTRSTSGDAVQVLDDAAGNTPEGDETHANLAASGTFAYLGGPYYLPRELAWISEGGKIESLTGVPVRPYATVNLTANGRRIAAASLDAGRYVIRVIDLDRGSDDALQLPNSAWRPVWYRDGGNRLAFVTMTRGHFDIHAVDVTTSAPPIPILEVDSDDSPLAFLPDGKTLIIQQSDEAGRYPIRRIDVTAPGKSETIVPFSSGDTADVSPDGKFVAVRSARSGTDEIYVAPADGSSAPVKVTNGGGTIAAWAPKGHLLLCLRAPEIVAVPYTIEGGQIRFGAERIWARVEGSYAPNLMKVAPDGRVLVAIDRKRTVRPLRVIVNWQNEIAGKLAR